MKYDIIQKYYESFNAGDRNQFFSLLTDNVIHEINQGKKEVGKELFRAFMERMDRHYKERVVDLVLMGNEEGDRVAAEFFVEGKYLSTDAGLPEAKGQTYRVRCGAFFELTDGKISRVTTYYNLNEWIALIK